VIGRDQHGHDAGSYGVPTGVRVRIPVSVSADRQSCVLGKAFTDNRFKRPHRVGQGSTHVRERPAMTSRTRHATAIKWLFLLQRPAHQCRGCRCRHNFADEQDRSWIRSMDYTERRPRRDRAATWFSTSTNAEKPIAA
jgi:hypothetical protein